MEQEPIDSREQVSDIVGRNTGLANAQRKPENDIHQMQANLDNMLAACKTARRWPRRPWLMLGDLLTSSALNWSPAPVISSRS